MKPDKKNKPVIRKSKKVNRAKKISRYIFLLVMFTMVLLQTNAQSSGLRIAASNEIGTGQFKGNLLSNAALRKIVQQAKKQEIPATKDIAEPAKKEIPDDVKAANDTKKSQTIKEIPAPVVTTSATIYDIPGSTAVYQYTSLQASFKFRYYLHGTTAQPQNISDISQVIELYKLEKGANTRSFCIPAGSCTSVNIPIQITGRGLLNGNSNGAGAESGYNSCFTVLIPSGYLQPGEYAFIDKSSLSADFTALQCFAFTVKQ